MGTYLNPGKGAFEEAVSSEIYVDKTGMIPFLNSVMRTKQKYVSVSRPRRFGKTMAADMICAYYDREADSRDLFELKDLTRRNTARSGDHELSWDAYLGKFDVIRVVMTDFMRAGKEVLEGLASLKAGILDELAEAYPGVRHDHPTCHTAWTGSIGRQEPSS